MKKLTALLLTALLLFGTVGVAQGSIEVINLSNELYNADNTSNEYLHHAVIDQVYLDEGTVTAYVYSGAGKTLDINTLTNLPSLTQEEGQIRLTHFVFELTNQYRPSTDFVISMLDKDKEIVHVYVYGEQKDMGMYSFVSGLEDCYNNEPYSSHSDSDSSSSSTSSSSSSASATTTTTDNTWIDKYSPAQMAAKTITSFKINDATYIFNDKTETMDVAPYAKDNRTYVPVRYLAYSLGVAPEGIMWNQESQTVTVSLNETTVNMTIGSNIMTVNGTPTTMDVAPEAVDGRTMLPARYLAEALGATVTWNAITNSIEITKAGD